MGGVPLAPIAMGVGDLNRKCTMTSTKNDVPFLMKFWGGLYNAAPKIYIPGTEFDIGFILLSALFL